VPRPDAIGSQTNAATGPAHAVASLAPAPEGRLETTCRVCGSPSVVAVLDLGDQPHCNSLLRPGDLDRQEPRYPLRFGVCEQCTTAQIDYTVPKETMFGDYLYVSGTTKALRAHFRASAARLRDRLMLEPGDLVVDIGSNDGTWLQEFRALGLTGLGVEPATNLAATAEENGVRTLNRFFDAAAADAILAVGVPRLVTAAGVFFHLEELHSATAGVAKLCEQGAVFCVQAIYLGGMLRNTAFDQIYHEHLTYWRLGSLERLLSQYGLETFSVRLQPIHGGTLEFLVGVKGAREIESSVTELREQEERQGLGELATYRAFAERVWELRTQLRECIEGYVSAGKTVYAFGAPAKGATLLNSFGLGTELLPLAVERNPLKVGLVIPGVRIPIVEEGTVPDPDAYLMLPWNFLDEFVERKKGYLEGGGAFIVPIPSVRVVGGQTGG
jgi:hypothetical protein